MSSVLAQRAISVLASGAMVVGPLAARAEQVTMRCESYNFGYRYCPARTEGRVVFLRQLSLAHCRQDKSWGYDQGGVWVDRGCEAEFQVGNEGGHHHDKAGAAVAAIAGIALLGALMSSSKAKQDQQEVPAWAVGNYSGFDAVEQVSVQVNILPGGSLTGSAGSTRFNGSLHGSRMEAGRHVFNIRQLGNGFEAVDEQNAQHRVVFQRAGGGY